jgi:hypothetical protein
MGPEKFQWPTGAIRRCAGNSTIKTVATKVTYARENSEGTGSLRMDIVNDYLSLITTTFPTQKENIQYTDRDLTTYTSIRRQTFISS